MRFTRRKIRIPSDYCSGISIFICSARVAISSSRAASVRRPSPSTASTACDSPSGRRMPRAWPSSAISIPGIAGGIPCACATAAESGSCSFPAWHRDRVTNTTSPVRAGSRWRGRPTPSPDRPSRRPAPPPSFRSRTITAGATTPGCNRAANARRPTRRSPSMRCISARGSSRGNWPRKARCGISPSSAWCRISSKWGSRMSSFCR